jgi:hypothetical protein
MERILNDIRSVPGITGVLVLDIETLESYHLLPVTFSSDSIQDIQIKLLKLSEKMTKQSRLDLKFENGAGLVYNLERSTVLIFGKSNLNFSVLGLVLKSALQAIERKLDSKAKEPAKTQLTSTLDESSRRTTLVIDKKVLGLLIEAVNLVAKGLMKAHGSFYVTQNLRKSKESLIKEFPFVASFYVDNNATISLIKGKEELLDEKFAFALIKWIHFFVNSFDPTQSLDVRDLTAKINQPLEEIGFYSIYRKMADLKAQNP